MNCDFRNKLVWPVHLTGLDDPDPIEKATICPKANVMAGRQEGEASMAKTNGEDEAFEDLNHTSELPPRPNNLSIRRASPKKAQSSSDQKKYGSKTLKRRPRVENVSVARPKLDEKEIMRQETKLIVLEYLSSLPAQQIQARNKRSSSQVLKAKTIHSTERPFVDVIEKKRNSAKLSRRNSEQYDEKMREKLRNMAVPLRKSLTPEVLEDNAQFDKSKLKENSSYKRSPRLSILRLSAQAAKNCPETPITCVTSRLEEMSQDIMKDYPQLLDEHLSELLTPLDSGEKLSYDEFASVAKTVFEKQLARFAGSIWTKVAMVFNLVKEVVFSGGLSEIQVEVLVEYATRFISEQSLEPIEKEGGWTALELHDDVLIGAQDLRGNIYDPLGSDIGEDVEDGQANHRSRENSTDEANVTPSYFGALKDSIKSWTTYGAAALAVSIGVAYSLMKQQ